MPSLTLKSTQKVVSVYSAPLARLTKLGIKHETTIRPAQHNDSNRLELADRPAHDWYRFILSFPPHLVRQYIERFGLGADANVLDPFCGTGTTIVECQKLGLHGIGIEAHPMAYFASTTKIDWSPDPDQLELAAAGIAERTLDALEREGIIDDPQPCLLRETPPAIQLRHLPVDAAKLLLTDCISTLPLHKTLVLLDAINASPCFGAHFRLALARALVTTISNLHFGPEVGVGPAKDDAPVVSTWLTRVCQMAHDIRLLKSLPKVSARVLHADARIAPALLEPASIDTVITSPPYPNEKDYTRTTRLESVILGFFRDRATLRDLKRTMLRSNTRGVYKGDDDDRWVAQHPEIERLAIEIERRRIEMGKTSGFERLYARVTKLYFGGMAKHLAELRPLLRPGAQLAYVVGDQASYLRVMIRTGQLLGSIAEQLGYEVTALDLFRTRLATATREQLREEVLVLRWPGNR
ncbi:MAG: DNA methyltransferase [Verrucomicrobia bacterium]|nr:DNA methyltransferase [Verrucomicrobiota bacterium]